MGDIDNPNEYITVKCNKCGIKIGFFPRRVICIRACECGNDDYGSPRDWKDDKFGNFTLIKREEWIIKAVPEILLL